jgi:hypothetical protein
MANYSAATKINHRWYQSKYIYIYEESLNSDGQQIHQYQQNEQSPLIQTEPTEHNKTTTYDVGNSDPGLGQAQE